MYWIKKKNHSDSKSIGNGAKFLFIVYALDQMIPMAQKLIPWRIIIPSKYELNVLYFFKVYSNNF